MKARCIFLTLILPVIPLSALAVEPTTLKTCQICHGKDLEGKKKNPPIVGMTYESLLSSITNDVPKKMQRVAAKLTPQEKEEVSRYISELGSKTYEE